MMANKNKTLGDFVLVLLLGWLGIHKFKEGKIGMGLLYMFTLGLFGIGWVYDIYIAAKECGLLGKLVLYTRSQRNSEIEVTKPEYSESLTDELKKIDSMSIDGWKFEHYCAELLSKNGFNNIEVTSGSGDYGVDVLAERDGVSYAIQCKCYSGSVGNKAVQEAFSGKEYHKRMVAAVMTNSVFTQAAINTAAETRVLLWDRSKLIDMLINANPEFEVKLDEAEIAEQDRS